MNKRIIFCADGTWDSAANDTNVYKFYKAISISSGQVAFYDDGVGADGIELEKLTGGAFGNGLFQKIKDGYTKISHVYEQGDEIFIVGFSRGAFTARCLAGMIAVCGLPTANFDDDMVSVAFEAYRQRDKDIRAATLNSLNKYNLFNASIKMVGVWDTVGALGIPALFGGVDPLLDGFLDTDLHPDVLNAYHALSIDERRPEFPPTLWKAPDPPLPGQVLEQVWFAGVHCDVGGGYPETGLSDITLGWMFGKAAALGLEINDAVLAQYASLAAKYALDQIHNSWSVFWGFPRTRSVAKDAAIGNSVAIRSQFEPSYKPSNLSLANGTLLPSYNLVQVVNPAN